MEGLKLRSYIVAGLMLLVTLGVMLTPAPGKVPGKNEDWMEKVAPAKVSGYSYIPGQEDPMCTYKSPEMVYKALVPTVGILARVYESGGQKFDVNLIASRDKGSFHDPRVCFSAQGYKITEEQAISIKTKTRGEIPATLAKMDGPNGPTVAVFFYRGPGGLSSEKSKFYGDTTKLKFALLFDQVKGRTDGEAVFYRFIPEGDLTTERLESFISLYMDQAGKDSNGYF